jgi:deoxyxylulose-5-phosphate synthase
MTEVALQPSEKGLDSDGRGGYGSSLIFEEMGLRYLGPIDGHDLPTLLNCLEFAKSYDKPIVLHVLTQKGKGYDVAIAHPEKFHGTWTVRCADRRLADAKTGGRRLITRTSSAKRWSNSVRRTTRSSASPQRCRAAPG